MFEVGKRVREDGVVEIYSRDLDKMNKPTYTMDFSLMASDKKSDLLQLVVVRDRIYFVTVHEDEDGKERVVWRTCCMRIESLHEIVPPESWRTHDFVSFATETDEGFPLLVIGRRGELAVCDGTRCEGRRFYDFKCVEAKQIKTVGDYKYFIAPIDGPSHRLYRFDVKDGKLDAVYDPSIELTVEVGDDVKTPRVVRSVVTNIEYAYFKGSVFVVSTHKQCGERFESWRRMTPRLDKVTPVEHQLGWGCNTRKIVVSGDEMKVMGFNSGVLQYRWVGFGEPYFACCK